MSNLADRFLSKVERIASHPNRLMGWIDAFLDRVATKDKAAAACLYYYNYNYCTVTANNLCPNRPVTSRRLVQVCKACETCPETYTYGPWKPYSCC